MTVTKDPMQALFDRADGTDPQATFRRRLRAVRKARRLTQDQLAARVVALGHPINRVTVARIESGASKHIHLDDALVLCQALDLGRYGLGDLIAAEPLELTQEIR